MLSPFLSEFQGRKSRTLGSRAVECKHRNYLWVTFVSQWHSLAAAIPRSVFAHGKCEVNKMPHCVFETNVALPILACCAGKEFWSDHDKKKKKGKWWHGIKSTILCVWERFTGNTWNSSYVCLPIPKEAQQRKQTQNGGGYCLPSYFSAACGNEYMGHSEQCPWLYSPGFCMLCDGYLQEGLTKES